MAYCQYSDFYVVAGVSSALVSASPVSVRGWSIDTICHVDYIHSMEWPVEYSDEFEAWWNSLDDGV